MNMQVCRLISFLERLICVDNWVVESVVKKLNILSVHLTSSKSLVGIIGLYQRFSGKIRSACLFIFLVIAVRLPISRTYSNYHDQF